MVYYLFQEEKPWELKKSDPSRLNFVLALSLESLRNNLLTNLLNISYCKRKNLNDFFLPEIFMNNCRWIGALSKTKTVQQNLILLIVLLYVNYQDLWYTISPCSAFYLQLSPQ